MAKQTAPTDPSTLEEDRFMALMQAITSCKTTLTEKIDILQTDFGLMRRDMDRFQDRLGEAVRRVGDSEDALETNGRQSTLSKLR